MPAVGVGPSPVAPFVPPHRRRRNASRFGPAARHPTRSFGGHRKPARTEHQAERAIARDFARRVKPHPHSAALVHIAEHIGNSTLTAHLLHYAFPSQVPKPKTPLSDDLLHELATHLDQAIHHVGHPTRPAIVSARAAAQLGHGIQGGVNEAAQKGGIDEGKRLNRAARRSAAEQGNATQAIMAKVNRTAPTVPAVTAERRQQRAYRREGLAGREAAARTAGEGALGLDAFPNPKTAGPLDYLLSAAMLLPAGRLAALGRLGKLGEEAATAGKAFETAGRGGRVGRAVSAAGRRAADTRVGRAAVAAGERTAPLTRPVGRTLRYAGRHPVQGSFGASVGAQVPAALGTGDPRQLLKGLEGTGTLASVLSAAGTGAKSAVPGIAGNALADLLSLPAQVPPSIYLTGRAAVKASPLGGGDSSELNSLIESFKRQDPIGALIAGDPGQALQNVEEHPVYAALEALGVKSAVGHGAGRLVRAEARQRPPLHVYGDVSIRRGPYSRDLIQRGIQEARDVRNIRKRPGPQVEGLKGPVSSIRATPRQSARYLASAVDRAVYANEQVRRGEQARVMHELGQAKPGSEAQANVVSLLAQRIARSPETAVADLTAYRDRIAQVQADLEHAASTSGSREERGWAKVQLEASRNTTKIIDAALKNPDPQALAAATDAYIRTTAPVMDELVKRGLLSKEQARKAALIPFAHAHMEATHGLSNADRAAEAEVLSAMKGQMSTSERGRLLGRLARIRSREQTLKPTGEPLSSGEIEAAMAEHGVPMRGQTPDVGFATQRMGSKGTSAFFRSQTERPRMASQRRTGAATAKGTLDPSWEALAEHAVNSRSIVDTVRGFDALTKRFGIRPEGQYFKSSHEARLVAEHPEEFGIKLPPVPGGYVPFRIAPWLAKTSELDAAKRFGDAAQAELLDQPEAAQMMLADVMHNARQSGAGDTVLMPKVVVDRLRQHFEPKFPVEKTIEAATGMFKGAVLPTSPGWATGNVVDNYGVRMLGTGLSPLQIVAGKRFGELMHGELGPEEAARAMESITPGGMYGSYKRIQPHRAVEQFFGTNMEPLWRAAHRIRQAPGVKTVGDLYGAYRDAVFNFDARFVEQFPQYAELARTAQHDLGMTRRQFRAAVKQGAPAVRDLAKGLRNTDEQIRYAKRVEATFGNWGKTSPAARRFLTSWAPFWMWSRAAIKFVGVTLPRDHPIVTALIAASENMTREERQKLGFDFAAAKPLPDWLQGAIPLPGGGAVKVSNLTSFGYTGDVIENLGSLPAPQFSSLIYALNGLDWKGDKLTRADGGPASQIDKAKAAFVTTAESFVPFLNVANSVHSYGTSGLSPARTYDRSKLNFLRSLHDMQQITVPISKGGSSSSSNPFDDAFGAGGGSSSNPFDSAFGGGGGSSGSSNPFDKVFK